MPRGRGSRFEIPLLIGWTRIEGIIVNSFVLAADSGAGSGLSLLVMFVPMFAIWYFLVIRPQQQQRRKVQQMLAELKTGDRVVTTGGIYGTIVGFRENVVQLQVATQVKIDVARSAIGSLQPSEKEKPDK